MLIVGYRPAAAFFIRYAEHIDELGSASNLIAASSLALRELVNCEILHELWNHRDGEIENQAHCHGQDADYHIVLKNQTENIVKHSTVLVGWVAADLLNTMNEFA